jgi:ubiquitin carboxyl-terminal hydrolase 34
LYKLKGVVVHYGSAEFGHYYSYINTKDDEWMEFNDSVIKEFKITNLESECFGGDQTSSLNDGDEWQ